ncbi:D-arabinono-1,4-lactone oxidase [Asanoa sp. NPDC049518]|uniref:D-arabinono-1,4-lactone oxidase n=1 Tax=unclassified Asanoa TaxID=2685164 RepID=UPI0034227CDD
MEGAVTASRATATSVPHWRNWAGNQQATARETRPGGLDELSAIVTGAAAAGERVKPVGSGHSFTDIAVTDGIRIDLAALPGRVDVDREHRRVTVPAGMTLATLNALLSTHGLALPNLGDIDAQTIAGAISTGTHGTGAAYGCLSTFVGGLTLVTGTGEVLRCDEHTNPEVFSAARVGLGALGVLTEVTLQCVEAFTLRAHERPGRLADVLADWPALVADNDHCDLYWFPYTDRVQVKTNNRVPADDRPLPGWRGWLDDDFLANTVFAGACLLGRAVPATVAPINAVSARALTERVYTGRSDAVFCTPRRVRFTEMEYGLPRDAFPTMLGELPRIIDRLPFKVQFPVEVRFTAADDIPLSHGYGRESVYVAVHQFAGAPYEPYFKAVETLARELGGRPHWGKLHYRDAESLRPVYPRFDGFVALRDRLDPHRVFANAYTERVLGS